MRSFRTEKGMDQERLLFDLFKSSYLSVQAIANFCLQRLLPAVQMTVCPSHPQATINFCRQNFCPHLHSPSIHPATRSSLSPLLVSSMSVVTCRKANKAINQKRRNQKQQIRSKSPSNQLRPTHFLLNPASSTLSKILLRQNVTIRDFADMRLNNSLTLAPDADQCSEEWQRAGRER